MSTVAEKNRKRIREMLHLMRPAPRDTADDRLRTIKEDVVVTSSKVYESGMITSLDLRLVDLYGGDDFEIAGLTSALPEHATRY